MPGLTVYPTKGKAPLTVEITAWWDCAPGIEDYSYVINFGDGETEGSVIKWPCIFGQIKEIITKHTYTKPGEYKVIFQAFGWRGMEIAYRAYKEEMVYVLKVGAVSLYTKYINGRTVKLYGYVLDQYGNYIQSEVTINITGPETRILKTTAGSNGYFEVNFTSTQAGKYTATATANGLSSNTVEFTISPPYYYRLTINSDKPEYIVGERIKIFGYINIDSSPAPNETISVSVFGTAGVGPSLGTKEVVSNQQGYYEATFTATSTGRFTAMATHTKTKNTNSIEIIVKEISEEYKITTKAEPSAIKVGQKVIISGWVYKITFLGYQGVPNTKVKINITNGLKHETTVITDSRGEYKLEITPTIAGNYKVTATAIELKGQPTSATTFTVTAEPVVVEVGSITISKKDPIGDPIVGQRVIFSGYVRDKNGKPVANQKVTVAEKDLLGQFWPLKDSKGNYIFALTNSNGYYEIVDDDGWPDMGYKTVWAITNKKIGGNLYVSTTFGLYTDIVSGVALRDFVISSPLSLNVKYSTAIAWDYELRIYFLKSPWATESKVKEAIPSFAAAVNKFIEPLGYKYVGGYLDWANSFIALCYKGKSPPLPLKAIISAIVAIAIVVGIIIISTQWSEVKKGEQKILEEYIREESEIRDDILNLYKEGKITYEQALGLMESAKITLPTQEECKLLGLFKIPVPAELCGIINGIVVIGLIGLGLYTGYKLISLIGTKKS